MIVKYNNQEYKVIVVRKNNKNTYIRVKDNSIYITTNYFTTNNAINKLLNDNKKSIERMIKCYLEKCDREDKFLIFGNVYEVIYDNVDKISRSDNKIITRNDIMLNKYLDELLKSTYYSHLMMWYKRFDEDIPIPNLKIRKMKTRWGVCNTKNNNVTLNSLLIKYDIECLDYVIVHELSHFLVQNHSSRFWSVVEKYYPNYKEIRKKLKE